jgi:hypothetical protein
VPLVTNSSTLASNEVNANSELYMPTFRNLMTFLYLLVKRTFSSCGVARRLSNRTLPFSQHGENYGLLLFDFANCSLIHIFALQNPHIVSIFPQSHRAEVDTSSFPNNCNVSLLREGCACMLVVRFVVLNVDDYFGLVAFQMARPTLYIAWHTVLSASDCDVHVKILTCLN